LEGGPDFRGLKEGEPFGLFYKRPRDRAREDKPMDKGISIIFFVALLAVLVFAGWSCGNGYAVSNNNEDTGNADATAGWQTYRDDTYGVEFKYPQGWTYSENRVDTEALKSLSFDVVNAEYSSTIDFVVSTSTISAEEEARELRDQGMQILEQSVDSVNGVSWDKLLVKEQETPLQFISYSTDHNGKSYSFSSNYGGEGTDGGLNQRNLDVLNGILGSFRFAE
jgi:hypothetical protein